MTFRGAAFPQVSGHLVFSAILGLNREGVILNPVACDICFLLSMHRSFRVGYSRWCAPSFAGPASAELVAEYLHPKQWSQSSSGPAQGWMQIMFLLYHYFAEAEIYNAIRVYIAAYVWMTGFGNFLLYTKGNSFTARRTLQMLFRLNFLGVLVCVALNNEYMLYYICAMHTFFTIVVALALYAFQSLNSHTRGMCWERSGGELRAVSGRSGERP